MRSGVRKKWDDLNFKAESFIGNMSIVKRLSFV